MSFVAIFALLCCCFKVMSVSVFYCCLCAFLFRCHCFNPSLCHLSPFLLSYVAVSRSCQCRYFTTVFVVFSVAVAVLTHLCHLSPFLLSHVAVSRPCRCRYFTTVFVVFSVAVTVLIHLCVICRNVCSPMLLFQGHVNVAILLLSLWFFLLLLLF